MSKQSKASKSFVLSISFPNPDDTKRVEGAVGKHSDGSGFDFRSNLRDCDWTFDSKTQAAKALSRVQKLNIHGLNGKISER